MHQPTILMALAFIGFIILVANLPTAECVLKKDKSTVIDGNRFMPLAVNDDENQSEGSKTEKESESTIGIKNNEDEVSKEEKEGAASTAMKNEGEGWSTISKKLKMKEKGIGEASSEQKQKETGNSGFQIDTEYLTIVALYFYKNPPMNIALKEFILQKYLQGKVWKSDQRKLYVHEKQNTDRLLNEQIDIILSGNVDKKCEEYGPNLYYYFDEIFLRNLVHIVERKFESLNIKLNKIQKQKKVFGLYLRHYNLVEKDGEGHKLVYKMTKEQLYRLNGLIDKIFDEENEPVFKNAAHYQRTLMSMMKKTAVSSAEIKESSIDKKFLRKKIDHLIKWPTKKMKTTYHKLLELFKISFGLYLNEKQVKKTMSQEQIDELDKTILEILFEGIEKIDKEALQTFIYNKFLQQDHLFKSVKKGEFEKPMRVIFGLFTNNPELNGGKIDPKEMSGLLRFQLDSLIYEILYTHVDDGFGLNFGSHIVKEIEKELNVPRPNDKMNHPWWKYAPISARPTVAIPAVHSFNPSLYTPAHFPPLAANVHAQQPGHFLQQPTNIKFGDFVLPLTHPAHTQYGYFVPEPMPSAEQLTYNYSDFEEKIRQDRIKFGKTTREHAEKSPKGKSPAE